MQAHLSAHAGIDSLAQQALLSRHHPCQIDGTAWQQPTTSASSVSHAHIDGIHGLGDSQPVGSQGKRATVEPAAERLDDKYRKGPEPGVKTPKKPDRKPLQELQPGQALSASPAAGLAGAHADRFCKADQLPRQPVQQEQPGAQPNGNDSQGLKPQSGLTGHRSPKLGSFADSNFASHMQRSGQRSAHEDSAAFIDRACQSHDCNVEPKEAPQQQPEGRAGAHHQNSLDLIDLFMVGLDMTSFPVRMVIVSGIVRRCSIYYNIELSWPHALIHG